jgi:hypothetical protein
MPVASRRGIAMIGILPAAIAVKVAALASGGAMVATLAFAAAPAVTPAAPDAGTAGNRVQDRTQPRDVGQDEVRDRGQLDLVTTAGDRDRDRDRDQDHACNQDPACDPDQVRDRDRDRDAEPDNETHALDRRPLRARGPRDDRDGLRVRGAFLLDCSKIERAFGLRPTPLEESVAATVTWWRARPGAGPAA